MVNNNNIAQDCGESANTVASYFDILEDTLVGFRLPAFSKVMKRRLVQAPRFYYFDVGIVQLTFWRTHTGLEVEAVIGDARIAIEIKSVEEVLPRHLKGLNSFAEDYPAARLIIVSLDPFNRRIGNVECIHILDFLASAMARSYLPSLAYSSLRSLYIYSQYLFCFSLYQSVSAYRCILQLLAHISLSH